MPASKFSDEALRTAFDAGRPWRDIARDLGAGYSTVRQRAYQLGLRRPSSEPTGSKNTARNRSWEAKHPEKRRAHKAVESALVCGTLQKEPCRDCGATNVQAHHPDYSRPLLVVWLCAPCHAIEHVRLRHQE